MTKTISTLMLASALTLGAATARADAPARRGELQVDGPAVKAVVVGPVTIHAYSGYSGGTLYTVPAVTGTDADCREGDGQRSGTTDLQADVVVLYSIPAGRVACLTTTRQLEVLWHARKDAALPNETPAATMMMARR
jgi:hypothetical protein